MAVSARIGAVTTLQSAVATAQDGTALAVSGAEAVLVEISGTFTNINVFFEGSLDGGVTYGAVYVRRGSDAVLVASVSPATVGLYRLEDARGLTHFRTRTTIGSVTGTITVKAVAVLY